MSRAGPEPAGPLETSLRLTAPIDLGRTLSLLRHGAADPCVELGDRFTWRATRTPEGPATQAILADRSAGALRCWAWGPGASWVLDHLGALVGADDDQDGFATLLAARPPGWQVVARLARRHPGLRVPRTSAVLESTVPAVLGQRVTSLEAARSHRELTAALGEPAPGPRRRMRLPPSAERLAATPSWAMHRFGIERHRAETIARAARAATRLEEASGLPLADARRRLRSVPGLGAWSAAEVALAALGDPDAVSVGDFHLPNQVAWALAGIPRGDDRLMLELLEPWRGQRGRVLRLLVTSGATAPRFGPKQPIASLRSM
ncbi:MAG: DNA-3-methyladenine glycosylase 2 family protein [Actinomycetota bacterium]|nr:DNA-3-methyladenine glycosylase 2 family protein [Actinomycetota bacterium]